MSMNSIQMRRGNGATLQWEWTGPFENYARSQLSKQWWRLQRYFGGFEDAVQEAAFIWCRLVRRLEAQATPVRAHAPVGLVKPCRGEVDNAAWLMALFKVTLHNEICRWAWAASRRGHIVYEAQIDDNENPAPEPAFDPTKLVLAGLDMSPALARVVRFLGEAPPEVLESIFNVPLAWSANQDNVVDRRLKRCAAVRGYKPSVLNELRELLAV